MTVHLYILKQVAVAMLFAVATLLFVALPGVMISVVHKMPSVELSVLLRFLPIVFQALVPYMLPLCFMLSLVSVFGRMAADGEWTALQLTGRHPATLLATPAMLSVSLGLLTFWIVSSQLPEIRKRENAVLTLATSSLSTNLSPGRTRINIADFYLIAASRDMESGTFFQTYFRYHPDNSGPSRRIDAFADEVDLAVEGDLLKLDATGAVVFDADTGSTARVDRLLVDVNVGKRIARHSDSYDRARYLTTPQIRTRLRAGGLAPRRERDYRFVIQYRAAMSAVYLVFAGLGAATGVLMRRGSRLTALAASMGYGVLYYICNIEIGQELGMDPNLPAWVGAWVTNLSGCVLSALLLHRAFKR